MSNEGLIKDNWEPQKETYTPTLEELEEIHTQIVSELFPQQDTLNEFPDIEFTLTYKGQNTWPQITIGSQNELGIREIGLFLRNSIKPTKVLSYSINKYGETLATENPTDSENQKQFKNRVEGLKNSIKVAKTRDVLNAYPSSKHKSFS